MDGDELKPKNLQKKQDFEINETDRIGAIHQNGDFSLGFSEKVFDKANKESYRLIKSLVGEREARTNSYIKPYLTT